MADFLTLISLTDRPIHDDQPVTLLQWDVLAASVRNLHQFSDAWKEKHG